MCICLLCLGTEISKYSLKQICRFTKARINSLLNHVTYFEFVIIISVLTF